MRYTIFKKIVPAFAALCLFTACHTQPQAVAPLAMPRHTTAIIPPKHPIGVQPTPDNVWDVSDIDLSKINPEKKLLSFTFDDAPGATLENILAVFASYNESHPDCPAFATLFCNGAYMNNDNLHSVSAAYTMGWELGNHGFSHADLTTLSIPEQTDEIAKTDALLKQIDGKAKHLFRAPYGRIDKEARKDLQTPILSWNVDTLDWTGRSEEEIYQTVMQESYEGSIVLMHDGPAATVQALKRLLPDLNEAGYQIVGVSMLAKAHGCTLKNGSEYIRARKNGTA